MVTPRLLPPPAGPRPVRASPAPGQAPLGHSYPARPALCPPPAASSSGRGKGGGGFGGAATPSPPPPAAVGATNDPQVPSTTMPTRAEGRADADAVADRLLAVFAGRDPASWRALIAASGEWPNLRARVLDRADEAAGEATDAAARLAARRLARKLRAVADELAAYDAELSRYLAADPGEWESMVAYGRASLPAAFFEHAAERVRAAAIAVKAGTPMPGLPPPADFAAAVTRLGALAAGVDVATSDPAAADAAAAEFHALLGEPDSLAAAEARIDDLAASGRLDPAFMMTAAKAYQATKESDYTRDEVKEIMYKLYRRARHSFSASQPPEMRIMRYLLTLPGEVDVRSALAQAFTPGDGPMAGAETSAPNSNEPRQWLFTTPPALLARVEAVLAAYEAAPIRGAKAARARKVFETLNPKVVGRLKKLKELIRKEWM